MPTRKRTAATKVAGCAHRDFDNALKAQCDEFMTAGHHPLLGAQRLLAAALAMIGDGQQAPEVISTLERAGADIERRLHIASLR